ncbi:hypothetical protein [Trichormus azollae]|jgi:hypothetical protein|uniref:Uncharacterized protein n=1 Tax=Nostoc azollae (strain 0708) TaxID=551115 RepID=D7DY40_NOSA0|nr:hypothetical protein [Trichormus azollae]ADI64368.1 hypothetical protein Aazo_2440 ['Nostoc azollae' 0708]
MFPVAATSYGLIKLSISDLFNTDVLYSPIACASSLSPVNMETEKKMYFETLRARNVVSLCQAHQ